MNEINKEHTADLGPSKDSIKGRYKDDNLRRAQEITSMFPIGGQFENFDYQALQSLQSEQSEWREAERRQYDMWLAQKNRKGRVDSRSDPRFDSYSSYYNRKHPTHSRQQIRPSQPIRRPIRTEFSEKEKAEILSRVMLVGIERAALEAGTSKEIVMHWLQLIDESISEFSSEINSAWNEFDAAAAAEAEAIAGYETEYRRILEHRTHYKKPLEQIIAILTRAEEVGTKQAARELRSTRTDIIRWRRMFPKQIWEQLRQWVKENDAEQQDVQADGQQINITVSASASIAPVSVLLSAPDIIIARADEVGDEQAAHEFKISAATMKRLRLQAGVQNGQAVRAGHDGHDGHDSSAPSDPSNPSASANLQKTLKWHTREERLEILARADEIGINGAAAETGICTSTISRWRKELGRHKYAICTPDQKVVILARADEIGDKGAAAEFNVSVGSIVTWRRKTGKIKHKKYTLEEKAEILARADEIGAKKAAIEFNINVGTVSEWRKEAGCLKNRAYSQEEKVTAVARSNEVGIKQAAAELEISPNTIILWRSKFGVIKRRKNINADERLVIWNRANEVGRLQAAREYGISPVTIGNWDWKYGMKNPPLHGPKRAE